MPVKKKEGPIDRLLLVAEHSLPLSLRQTELKDLRLFFNELQNRHTRTASLNTLQQT